MDASKKDQKGKKKKTNFKESRILHYMAINLAL